MSDPSFFSFTMYIRDNYYYLCSNLFLNLFVQNVLVVINTQNGS